MAFSKPSAVAGWVVLAGACLLAAGGAASRAGGWSLGWAGWGAAACVVAGVALLARSARPGAGTLALALLPLVAGLLAGLPVPGLEPLSGPPLAIPILAVVVAILVRSRPAWARVAFLPIVLALYVSVSLRAQTQVGAEGDEPHYLMVAESLMRDGDVALESDYAAGRYRAFYRTRPSLAPHYLVRGKRGEIYSQQALGLSLLILPAYALAGYAGASLFMALLAVLLARETRLLVADWTGDEQLAGGVAWAVALSPPLVHFAGLVFTEVPAALALALALRRLRAPREQSARSLLAAGLALAVLPWLNVRFAALPLILVPLALAARPRVRAALALMLPVVASGVALALYHHRLYGFFDPRRVYGKHPGFAWGRLPGSLEAILFDQEFGFLVYAPIFALALPGLWLLARRSRWQAWLALVAPALVLIGTAATWRMWWGGFAPPGRFLVPLLPALAVGVAAALRSGLSASSALLIGWSVFMGLAGASEPRLVHRDRDGSSPLLREFSGAEEWTRLLPRFIPADADPRKHELALVWAAALALAVAASRRPRACTALRLGLACAGLCATAAIASSVSVERTGGRDAVRVIGRPALTLPDWTFAARAEAAWGTDVLDWGPAYEPHHHTGGAVVGSRLALPPGRYLLELGVDPLPGSPPPLLEVAGEGAGARFRRVPVTSDTWSAAFEVSPGEPAVTLRLQGGGPLILRELRLRAQPPPKPAGPSLQQGRTG